jgi:hypothetical protein
MRVSGVLINSAIHWTLTAQKKQLNTAYASATGDANLTIRCHHSSKIHISTHMYLHEDKLCDLLCDLCGGLSSEFCLTMTKGRVSACIHTQPTKGELNDRLLRFHVYTRILSYWTGEVKIMLIHSSSQARSFFFYETCYAPSLSFWVVFAGPAGLRICWRRPNSK